MIALHQFDYVFALAMIFAFLDAWNIGANDVGNSFASSVSSRALRYWQAMILAALCEFLGASLAGSRVSDTIRNRIVDVAAFEDNPSVLMLTMACALVGSSIFTTIATSYGMPVSTTHSIVGAVIGSAIAAKGANHVVWGWAGFSQIVASWFIAPAISGCFGAIIFLVCKYTVLERKNALRNGLILVPLLVFATFCILTMLIVWRGAPNLHLNNLSGGAIIGSIFGVGGVAMVLYIIFLYPYMRRRLVHNDWTLKWYHVFVGPVYWFKSTEGIPPMPEGKQLLIDYYAGRRFDSHGNRIKLIDNAADPDDESNQIILKEGESPFTTDFKFFNVEIHAASSGSDKDIPEKDVSGEISATELNETPLEKEEKLSTRELWWILAKQPSKWWYLTWLVLSHGFTQDVINSQVVDKDMLSVDPRKLHGSSKFYDNRVEYLFSLLQCITAGTMSFAHGSNDIANATGPLATIYLVYTSNTTGAHSDVPVWVLCYAGAALVIGAWTFGYNIMRNLGNKFILQSPSRGFSIELATAVTTVMATQLAIPISTTQCAVGATVFVGLCNKQWKTVNWRMVAWCYLGWIITLPCAGIIAGCVMGIIINAPHEGLTYSLQN